MDTLLIILGEPARPFTRAVYWSIFLIPWPSSMPCLHPKQETTKLQNGADWFFSCGKTFEIAGTIQRRQQTIPERDWREIHLDKSLDSSRQEPRHKRTINLEQEQNNVRCTNLRLETKSRISLVKAGMLESSSSRSLAWPCDEWGNGSWSDLSGTKNNAKMGLTVRKA